MKMKMLVAAAGLVACALGAQAAEPAHAHWDYAGKAGPTHWGELEHDFASCKLGKLQSPIDIRGAKAAKLAPLGFHYHGGAGEIVNNGHTVQVNLADGGSLDLASGNYKLVQFHFHTPSEESINGKRYPLVAHLVHKNDAGDLAVVAVLFKEGKENAALKQVFAELPGKAGDKHPLASEIDLATLLPAKHGYYAYMGSLTTPPCSEGVHWQVLKQPVELSKGQLASFRKLYAMNARPLQPLNGRAVEASN
jgi:carbonic anhydrase